MDWEAIRSNPLIVQRGLCSLVPEGQKERDLPKVTEQVIVIIGLRIQV